MPVQRDVIAMPRFSTFAISALIACLLRAEDVVDVSAVKLHPVNVPCGNTRVLQSGQLEAACFTLETMIREGLNILPNQLYGGPDWVRRDQWDISAKATSMTGKPEEEIYKRVLLAVAYQRFALELHVEKQSATGFALRSVRSGKYGPRLTMNSGEPHFFELKPGPRLIARGITMSELADWLRWPVGAGRLVVDKTGLPGVYDLTLRWTPLNNGQTAEPPDSADEPSIFRALREQLGLKVTSTQVEQARYQIRRADRPAPN